MSSSINVSTSDPCEAAGSPSLLWKPFVKLQNQHFDSITRVKFSPAGNLVATAAADGIVRVFDVSTQQRVGVSSHHFLGINDICWDSRGEHLYTASSDGVAACLSVAHLEATLPLGPKVDLARAPTGPVIAREICAQRGVVGAVCHARSTATERQGLVARTQSDNCNPGRSGSARKKVSSQSCPQSSSAGILGLTGIRRPNDTTTGGTSGTVGPAPKPSTTSRSHGTRRTGEHSSGPGGGTSSTGTLSQVSESLDCDTSTVARGISMGRFPPADDPSFNFLFASAMAVATPQCQGDYFLTGGFDEFVRKWDIRQFATVTELRAHSGAVTSLELSNDDRLVASGGFDGCLRLWTSEDLACWQSFQTSREPNIPLAHCVFSPNDELVLAVPICGGPRLFRLSQCRPHSNHLFSFDLPMPPMDCCPIELQNFAFNGGGEVPESPGVAYDFHEVAKVTSPCGGRPLGDYPPDSRSTPIDNELTKIQSCERRGTSSGTQPIPIDFSADSPALADCFRFWSSRGRANDVDVKATDSKVARNPTAPDAAPEGCQGRGVHICQLHGECGRKADHGGWVHPLRNATTAEILSSPGGFVRAAFWGTVVLVPQILRRTAIAPHAHHHSPWAGQLGSSVENSSTSLPERARGCLQAEIFSWNSRSGKFATALIASPFHSHCQVTAVDALQPLRPAFDPLHEAASNGPQLAGGLLASAGDHPDCSLVFWVPYVRR